MKQIVTKNCQKRKDGTYSGQKSFKNMTSRRRELREMGPKMCPTSFTLCNRCPTLGTHGLQDVLLVWRLEEFSNTPYWKVTDQSYVQHMIGNMI